MGLKGSCKPHLGVPTLATTTVHKKALMTASSSHPTRLRVGRWILFAPPLEAAIVFQRWACPSGAATDKLCQVQRTAFILGFPLSAGASPVEIGRVCQRSVHPDACGLGRAPNNASDMIRHSGFVILWSFGFRHSIRHPIRHPAVLTRA